MELLLLMLVPITWPFFAKYFWPHDISYSEMSLNIVLGILITFGGYLLSKNYEAFDQQVFNTYVVKKDQVKVSCEHSYVCNCRTINKTTTCSTCYEHAYDYDWRVFSQNGYEFNINRVDRRGTKEPPRFTAVKMNDPVSYTGMYVNYIKAVPESLFNAAKERAVIERFEKELPKYPLEIYDYHYIDRVLTSGLNLENGKEWNSEYQKMLSLLGSTKKVNSVLILTKNPDENYANAVRASWLGGKINDVVVVIGAPEYPKIAWVKVFSWSDSELFKVQLRDDLLKTTLDPKETTRIIGSKINQMYVIKNIKDFDYLETEVEPPLWLLILLFFLTASASVGLSILFTRTQF